MSSKRNASDYSNADELSLEDVDELLQEVLTFKNIVVTWVNTNYPEYLIEREEVEN